MHLLYVILLGGLGFAVALLVLFGICYAKDSICSRNSRRLSEIQRDSEIEARYTSEPAPSTTIYPQLTSRPSAPLLTEVTHENERGIGVRPSFDETSFVENARITQNELLVSGTRATSESLGCQLVIAVTANQSVFGGYCIKFKEQWVQYYSLKVEDLPWRFNSAGEDYSEYDMKNLLFALMVWSDEIRETKRLLIYTANHAINADNNRYGRRAAKLLEHYSGCEGVVVVNENRYNLNPRVDPNGYSIYIQPAEDLASWNLNQFREFVSGYYGIGSEQFSGSHSISQRSSDRKYKTTDNYTEYIKKVRDTMRGWIEPCPKCGYVDDETASMMSINRIPS